MGNKTEITFMVCPTSLESYANVFNIKQQPKKKMEKVVGLRYPFGS